jgi:hypothetical protein
MGPAPEPAFDSSVCLKGAEGRCAHLWQIVTSFAHGNPAGTFEPGKEPKAVSRSCLRSPSEEMDLRGLTVVSCNAHSDPAFRADPEPFNFDPPEPEKKDPLQNLPVVNMGAQKESDPND